MAGGDGYNFTTGLSLTGERWVAGFGDTGELGDGEGIYLVPTKLVEQ